jgi:hypothetical protein
MFKVQSSVPPVRKTWHISKTVKLETFFKVDWKCRENLKGFGNAGTSYYSVEIWPWEDLWMRIVILNQFQKFDACVVEKKLKFSSHSHTPIKPSIKL